MRSPVKSVGMRIFISLAAMSSSLSGKKESVLGSGVSSLICGSGSSLSDCLGSPSDSSSLISGWKSVLVSRTPGWPRLVRVNHTCSDLEYLVSLPWYLYQGPPSCIAPVGG